MSEKTAQFRILKNGPLEITGSFRVVDDRGRPIETKEPAYLCRCGGSANKPYCDGTHNSNGFTDA